MLIHGLRIGIATSVLLSALVTGSSGTRISEASTRIQEENQPNIVLTGLQLVDQVRYAVTLRRPLSTMVTNVQVEVMIPETSERPEPLQTPNRTVFLGAEGSTLSWRAPSYEPGDPVDAFAFRLARPFVADAHVRASWEIDGQVHVSELRAAPDIEMVSAAAGEVILGPDAGSRLVGETGVHITLDQEPPGSIALRLRKLGPEANPPAGVGSPWWCAALEVEGLPAETSALVVVPLRQPLPPGLRVELFAARNNGWEKLDDQGIVTGDGQFVTFRHPGGTVAAGVSTVFQPSNTAGVLTIAKPKLQLGAFYPSGSGLEWGSRKNIYVTVKEQGGASAQGVELVIRAGQRLRMVLLQPPSGFTCSFPNQDRLVCDAPRLAAGTVIGVMVNVLATTTVPEPRVWEREYLVATTRNNKASSGTAPYVPPTTTDTMQADFVIHPRGYFGR